MQTELNHFSVTCTVTYNWCEPFMTGIAVVTGAAVVCTSVVGVGLVVIVEGRGDGACVVVAAVIGSGVVEATVIVLLKFFMFLYIV